MVQMRKSALVFVKDFKVSRSVQTHTCPDITEPSQKKVLINTLLMSCIIHSCILKAKFMFFKTHLYRNCCVVLKLKCSPRIITPFNRHLCTAL